MSITWKTVTRLSINCGDLGETGLLVIFFIIFFCVSQTFKLSIIKIYVNTISHNLNSSSLPYTQLPDPKLDMGIRKGITLSEFGLLL